MTVLESFLLATLFSFVGFLVGYYIRAHRDDKILHDLIIEQEENYKESCECLRECKKENYETEEDYLDEIKAANNDVKYDFTKLYALKTARVSIW